MKDLDKLQIEVDGIKLVHGILGVTDGAYLDTQENRNKIGGGDLIINL